MSEKTYIDARNVSLDVLGSLIFEHVSVSVSRGDRIGLVGTNGSGKSTLLKVLSGIIYPSEGRVSRFGEIFYLPQLDLNLFNSRTTLRQYASSFGLDWHRVQASANRSFGLRLAENQEIRDLSGGELVKLHAALMDASDADVLLLDEPTNHLDVQGLKALRDYLLSTPRGIIIVSHDPFFLDEVVSRIWELRDGKLTEYGANYSEYQAAKEAEQNSRRRSLEAAQKKLTAAKLTLQKEAKRRARSEREGRKQAADRSMSAYERGYFAERASKTAGKQKNSLEQTIEERSQLVASLKDRRVRKVAVKLTEDSLGSGRSLFSIQNGVLSVAGTRLLDHIDLRLRSGERIVLVGRNGSGKSSLAQALVQQAPNSNVSLSGKVWRSHNLAAGYVDQRYSIVVPSLEVYDNVEKFNPGLSHGEIRQQLARFLFFDDTVVHKRTLTLSGGETARLTLAMVTARPIDLLVLDEPTNNLDIDTLDNIAEALNEYHGALLVISHNIRFLHQLQVTRAYMLRSGSLIEMKSSPESEKDFFEELIEVDSR